MLQRRRRNKSLYGAKIREAIEIDQAWLQSEKLPSFLPFFVREDLLKKIHNNTNHLICGRRGTGKTHLLGAFFETINNTIETDELALEFSCMEIIHQSASSFIDESPEFTKRKNIRILTNKFFKLFIEKLINHTRDYLDKRRHRFKNERELNELKRKADDRLIRILEEIHTGKPLITSTTFKETTRTEQQNDKRKSLKLGTEISSSGLKFEGGLGYKKDKEEGSWEVLEKEINGIITIDITNIRNTTLELLDLLGIKTLYILIDEWMELDKTLRLGVQPYFAQFLKMCFFSDKRFSVKIASVWHQTDLYDRLDLEKSQGIELGEDIQLGVDLDTAFLTEESDILDFFTNMLFKRLCHQVEDIKIFKTNDKVDDIFIHEIFDNKRNFIALIAASHGIPRDFWHLFERCATAIKSDFTNYCIHREIIREEAKNIYLKEKRKNLDEISAAWKLWGSINRYMDSTGQNFFLVHNPQVKPSIALRKLIDEELIHQIPSAVTPRIIRDEYKVFNIDYGNYIDWLQTKSVSLDEALDESVVPRFGKEFAQQYKSYIIDIDEIEDNMIQCSHCNRQFDMYNLVYAKHSICPRCGEKIELKT